MIFNLVDTLINESLPLSWFSYLNGGENVSILHSHFLTISTLSTNLILMVLKKKNLLLRMLLTIPLAKLRVCEGIV